MEYYKNEIAGNPRVEMLLMAGEPDANLARWASKTKMPWPMLTTGAQQSVAPLKSLRPRGWPTYYLVNAEGEVLAKGVGSSAPVKAKIKELAGNGGA